MLLNDEVKMLRQVPMFSGIAAAKLKLLAFTSERVAYRGGEVLFHQGEDGDAAYVILRGQADVLVNTPQGEVKVAELSENSVVGEIAILCDIARTATVRAVTPVEALRISKENFCKMMMDFPEMMFEVMRVLASRLSQTTAELSAELAESRKASAQGAH
jgi:CRP-like cAMP-binding protein